MLMTYGEYKRLERLRRARRFKRAKEFFLTMARFWGAIGAVLVAGWLALSI